MFSFFLPRLKAHRKGCCYKFLDEELLDHGPEHDFSVELLAWAIQRASCPMSSIETYLKKYDRTSLRSKLQVPFGDDSTGYEYPILFFAVERNSAQLISLLCNAGANPCDRAVPSFLPVLAYCVLSAEYQVTDTTDALIALLAAGAPSTDVPSDMWENYVEAPKTTEAINDKPKDKSLRKKPRDDWCKPEIRRALCRTLTLMQRYCLWKASHLAKTTVVTNQIAEAFDIRELFEIHYHIVGQLPAAQQVIDEITCHLLSGFRKPLVLLFAGPSGHGKTELASRMGDLLSLDIHHVDCTEMKHETDIFGPKHPYHGSREGSPLNNFLAEHAGLKSVVFLDEFDKTTDEVRKAMLLVLDSGIYTNRIDGKRLDCSTTMWIMATNQGQEQIQSFWDKHLQDLPEERQLSVPLNSLQSSLRRVFIEDFGAPLTGRIFSIVPFFPFTANEQAVVAYTFMRKLRNEVRKKIDIETRQFVRHIHLHFPDDGQLARHIVMEGYEADTGARSLDGEVVRQVEHKLMREFLNGEQQVTDDVDKKHLYKYDVRVVDGPAGLQETEVRKAGTTMLQFQVD